MRAGVVAAPGQVSVVDVRAPEPSEGEVLVRVEGCGVCGSSLPLWEGREWFSYPLEPGAPGHEVWGRLQDGHRVACLSYRGFAEWDVAREDHVVDLPPELDGLPFPGEALACAVNVARRAAVRARDRVAVVGMGFLGTVVARLLVTRCHEVAEVRRETAVDGEFDVVVECAGTQAALDTASHLVATGGRLVVAGFHQDGPRTVDMQSWNWRGLDVVNAHERDPRVVVDALREAVSLAASGAVDVEALVTHRFDLDDVGAAFAAAARRRVGFLKAVVCP
jgi:threonine dehydrogenase-like Zn-dependent dehydrogenase